MITPHFIYNRSTKYMNYFIYISHKILLYEFKSARLTSLESKNAFELSTHYQLCWAHFSTYKRIFNWQPFMNKVYSLRPISAKSFCWFLLTVLWIPEGSSHSRYFLWNCFSLSSDWAPIGLENTRKVLGLLRSSSCQRYRVSKCR